MKMTLTNEEMEEALNIIRRASDTDMGLIRKLLDGEIEKRD